MSLTEDQVRDKKAVFKELIDRYQELKPFTDISRPGRSLRADSLEEFDPPPAHWLEKTALSVSAQV
jgi:hypothetical protein